MKALSLWQPWASAITLQLKRIETRHWPTDYRGPLAIHAAKTDTRELRMWWEINVVGRDRFDPQRLSSDPKYRRRLEKFKALGISSYDDLPRGAMVATCELLDCQRTQDLVQAGLVSEEEMSWGNYEPGRFGWLLGSIVGLSAPIPYSGAQGLFTWQP